MHICACGYEYMCLCVNVYVCLYVCMYVCIIVCVYNMHACVHVRECVSVDTMSTIQYEYAC